MSNTLYKFFVVSDVHGEYRALRDALAEAGYEYNNPTHIFVSLGDDFDRGPNSSGVAQMISVMHHKVLIMGNHEEMFKKFLQDKMSEKELAFNCLYNGFDKTLISFLSSGEFPRDMKEVERVRNYINHFYKDIVYGSRVYYYETKHFIFCHAGIENREDWQNTPKDYMLWDVKDSCKPLCNVKKAVVIGHNGTSQIREDARTQGYYAARRHGEERVFSQGDVCRVHAYGNNDEHSIYISDNKIAIDGSVGVSKKVNVLVIEDYKEEL